jgi:phage terminase large subunit-like protein
MKTPATTMLVASISAGAGTKFVRGDIKMKTAAMVINEMEVFPKGRYDDLSDSTTQAMTVRAKGTS